MQKWEVTGQIIDFILCKNHFNVETRLILLCQNHKNNENFHFNNYYLLYSHYFSSKNDKTNNYHNKNLSHLSPFLNTHKKTRRDNFKRKHTSTHTQTSDWKTNKTLKYATEQKYSLIFPSRNTRRRTTTMVTYLLCMCMCVAFIISQWKMKLITAHYLFTRLPLLCIICILLLLLFRSEV